MSCSVSITSCYAFVPLEAAGLEDLRDELLSFGRARDMRGLTLIATEGINATVSGTAESIEEWKVRLKDLVGEIEWKDSVASKQPFERWSVKIKSEIVGLKDPAICVSGKRGHLSPEEWQSILRSEDVVVVDARNAYEVAIGKFRSAVDPGIDAFHEFPAWAKQAALPKEKKILMYCTGGIRCEKALLTLEAQGYQDVYQLEGGILAYLEKFPHGDFEGECFVFDHRVAVDQHLRPSQTYGLCPHCGNAGDRAITCVCGKERKICGDCEREETRKTCSKRCRNEVQRRVRNS